MSPLSFNIGQPENFENLPNAPIVEAVIHWQAPPQAKLELTSLESTLASRLPDYPKRQQQQKFEFQHHGSPEGSSINIHTPSWHGIRCESENGLNVSQFTKSGFVFSRLKPYDNWDLFKAEACRLWNLYAEIAEPAEIQRLGVRFINQITRIRVEDCSSLLSVPPSSPDKMRLPLDGFMHQDMLDIPDAPYKLNVIQTIQPLGHPNEDSYSLILDLDVFTTQPIQLIDIDKRLNKMRWIKNKAFFSYLTDSALARFRE